ASFDILGSIAHSKMLGKVGLLDDKETAALCRELRNIYSEIESHSFSIEEGVEDVHSQVETILTARLGDTGKKIHTGRSRNDQVLLDIKLFARSGIAGIVQKTKALFDQLISL